MAERFRTLAFILFGCFAAFGILELLLAKLPVSGYSQENTRLSTVAQERTLLSADFFLRRLLSDPRAIQDNLAIVERDWDVSYVPMLLEVARFLPVRERGEVVRLLESKTRNRFGADFDKWRQWNWNQDYRDNPEYAKFKSDLYGKIDPRFSEYFVDTKGAKIRLDEIRWGGVRRDGIPPLKSPTMLDAKQATYLDDSDVVFGIELNGDSRAYPKRILAWHEMFKDTIGGEAVCGVY